MQHRVPVAANVAGEVPRPVPAAAISGATLACPCPHRHEPCAAVAGLIGATEASAEAEAWISRVRPCSACRVPFEAARASLRHLRLGGRERRILVALSATPVHVVTQPGMTRSESAALRRAAQSLSRAGLVVPAAATGRAAVSLTQLGRYVLAAFGRYLEAGKPVRWTRPRAGVELPGREPSLLGADALALARAELEATLGELARLLVAAVRQPGRDATALAAASRHLDIKARGLRQMLARGAGSNAA